MALRRERIAERLAQLREHSGLTQEQAAQKVGITHRQWQRWESGESVPYPRNLEVIASRFGITVAEFFDDMPPSDGQMLERIEAMEAEIMAALRKQDKRAAEIERKLDILLDAGAMTAITASRSQIRSRA